MKFQHLPLIALLLFSSLAQAAAMELKSAAVVAQQQKENAQLPQAAHEEELLLSALPHVLLNIIRDYLFGEKGEAFLSILYRRIGSLGNSPEIYHANFADNGKVIIFDEDGAIKLWDMSTKRIKSRQNPTPYHCVNTSPDNNTIVAHLTNENIYILDTTGACLDTIKIDHNNPHQIATTNQAHTIVTASHWFPNDTVKIWDRATKNCTATILHAHNKLISGLIITNDGNTIITTSDDTMVKIWKKNGDLIATLTDHKADIRTLAINHDNTIIATGSEDKTAKLWDLKTKKCILTLQHTSSVDKVHIRTNGRIMTESCHGVLKIWDQKTGECIVNLTHKGCPWGHILAISPDDNTFVTGSYHTGRQRRAEIHKFDKDAHKELYNLTFTQLTKLKQLIDDFFQQAVSKPSTGIHELPAFTNLSPEQENFLLSLPARLQHNIREHFAINESQEQFEKRTGKKRKSCE